MRRLMVAAFLALLAVATPVRAHDFPRTEVAVRVDPAGLAVEIRASALGLGYDLPEVAADGIDPHRVEIGERLARRLVVTLDNRPVGFRVESTLAEEAGRFARVRLRAAATGAASARLAVLAGALFPNEPTHRTFVTVYGLDGALVHEALVAPGDPPVVASPGVGQSVVAVVAAFVREGIHHIAIGPDHLLFLVGLLLLGGGLSKLLKIVTAFTLAHSITLCLATLGWCDPPARFVEPVIALSIVIVGIHSLAAHERADLRALFAFGFGLIHGFGFAGALREMELPRAALGWSLVSFNVGVELGQTAIVLGVAPGLAWLRRARPALAQKVVQGLAWGVIVAGAYWLGQRLG